MKSNITKNGKETEKFGKTLLEKTESSEIICLFGEMGAGKTVLAKGIGLRFGIDSIKSPTYNIIHEYKGANGIPFVHVDCYRIEKKAMHHIQQIRDYCDLAKKIMVIEWAEKIAEYLPKKRTDVRIEKLEDDRRKITVERYE